MRARGNTKKTLSSGRWREVKDHDRDLIPGMPYLPDLVEAMVALRPFKNKKEKLKELYKEYGRQVFTEAVKIVRKKAYAAPTERAQGQLHEIANLGQLLIPSALWREEHAKENGMNRYFNMSGKALLAAAKRGDAGAKREIARRKGKTPSRSATKRGTAARTATRKKVKSKSPYRGAKTTTRGGVVTVTLSNESTGRCNFIGPTQATPCRKRATHLFYAKGGNPDNAVPACDAHSSKTRARITKDKSIRREAYSRGKKPFGGMFEKYSTEFLVKAYWLGKLDSEGLSHYKGLTFDPADLSRYMRTREDLRSAKVDKADRAARAVWEKQQGKSRKR